MSKFVADNPEQMAKALQEMRKRLLAMNRLVQTSKGRAVLRGCQIIEARAKEITKEKNHVRTGTLGRSWNSQIVRDDLLRVVGEIGSPLIYAAPVEALPATGKREPYTGPRGGKYPGRGEGGGILGPAAEQKFAQASEVIVKEGFEPALKRWETGR